MKKGEARNEREALIEKFVARINLERDGVIHKFITPKTLAVRYLAGIPTSDLYHLDKMCEKYSGPYSKAFFGSLKARVV